MQCAALFSQQKDRDLQLLPWLVDEVAWLDAGELASADEPAVLGGLWLEQEPEQAIAVLQKRSRHGRATLLVPRFRGGNLAAVLGAPASILVRPGDVDHVIWEDGEQYTVSAVSNIDTALHSGQWARSSYGTAVLCYRSSTASGPIVICTAALTSRAIGVSREEQRRLFKRVMEEIGSMPSGIAIKDEEQRYTDHPYPDEDSFLQATGPVGVTVALALIAANGDRGKDLIQISRDLLGVEISEVQISLLLQQLPECDPGSLASTLERLGWGAYLRRITRSREMEH